MAEITFNAPPTCATFMKSEAFGRLIAGPVGSGKTTACIFELFRRACEQAPAEDGNRYTRFAIVRQTLKQLKDTVLKDIVTWLRGIATFKVSDNTVYIEMDDIRSEWILIPLDNPEDQKRLLSMQLTGAWMSEAIEMDVGLTAAIAGRCTRYPSAERGVPTWAGIIADTNMPSEGSDWHDFMELDTPPDWEVFIQPGGLHDLAENLNYLNQTEESLKLEVNDPWRLAQGRKYYERLARGYGEDWVNRYVNAQYGNDPSGTAVFRESFNMGFHVRPELEPVYGHMLIVGQDFGRDPCSVITQMDHKGRVLVLEEVMAEDIGLEQHVLRSLKPALLQERYAKRPIVLIGDPAGRSKSTLYEENEFDLLKRLGFVCFPAPTNDIDPRIRAVEAFLQGQRGGEGAILFDRSRCPTLVRAMAGAYRYAKTKQGARKPTPDKSKGEPYSHIADALQYACLVAHGGMTEMMGRHMQKRRRRTAMPVSSRAWT